MKVHTLRQKEMHRNMNEEGPNKLYIPPPPPKKKKIKTKEEFLDSMLTAAGADGTGVSGFITSVNWSCR